MNFTANGLLAFGGSPIMAKEPLEMNDIARNVDGILINIGTLTEKDLQAMLLAGKIANQHNIPIVFDPVGVAARDFRSSTIKKLLNEVKFTAIKGKDCEMVILINIGTLTEKDLQAMLLAGKIANQHNIPIVLDPVGVAASDFRSSAIKQLLNEVKFTAIKGNAGEMAFLVNIPWQTKGVESID